MATAAAGLGHDESAAASALDQRLWHGHIPVVFSLHPSEVTTLHAPRPFYAMIPRMSYLVAQTRDVVEYFRDAAPPFGGLQGASIWFEAAGVPLKWHVPFGVLWDTLSSSSSSNSPSSALLPWPVTVHFQGFPADELLACENEKSVETHFMHSLKQATFLRSGSTKAIMSMPEAQQSQIWTSVLKNDCQSYRDATRDLALASDADAQSLRFVPVRVLVNRDAALQMPIAPLTDDAQEKTLDDVLCYLLPDVFPSRADHTAVLVHGITVPRTVSLRALYRSFAYADGFLYVAVITREQ